MAAAFIASEAKSTEQLGFDDAPTPPWVMVPMDGKRLVVLKDGAGLTVQLRGSGGSIVQFQEMQHAKGRGFLLSSVNPGTAFLEAKNSSGAVQAALEITVKIRKTLSTCFIGVFDQSRRGPVTGLNNAAQILEICNKLYRPQVNLELSHRTSRGVALTFDMPTGVPTIYPPFAQLRNWDRNTPGPLSCVSSRPPASFGRPASGVPFCILEDKIVPPLRSAADLEAIRRTQMLINIVVHVDASADYNIFFVKVLDQHASSGGLVGFTGAFTPQKVTGVAINACFIQDSVANGHTLAHELGHYLLSPSLFAVPPPSFLDRDGHSHVFGHLMFPHPGPLDIKIPKEQANLMNISGNP